MKSTFRVLFFLKRDKVKKNGNMPIMARITIDGKLAQFNTKLEVNPKNWQAKTGKVSGRGAEFTRMNEMLDGIWTVSKPPCTSTTKPYWKEMVMLPPKRYAIPF